MTGQPPPFQSILVANRGEIACRVMRTAKAMGLRTIAVHSAADAEAPHVKMADEACLLGPAPAQESYLDIDRIMAAIAETGADAVHPGYGFLSENAAFAKACDKAGIAFIGPPIAAIDVMGDKAKSKRRMIAAGVPCLPGYQGEDQDDDTLINAAKDVGFPLMVKAAAGGGGRGMRLVEDKRSLPHAIETARSEAMGAFGSGDLILERAITEPRHVEIQIFADRHGNVIHLGERDCSVQRRHQKVIEEAPCPVMTPELREQMGTAAVKAARDVDYVGAGTVEFLLDAEGQFFFLEMNTRLQVEHPVTEMITGLDLVAMQIRAAQGDELGLSQDNIALNGHAIEARLYAEDVAADFLPATGPVDLWAPATGDGIRIDDGIATGGEVSQYYDPMLAKVMAHGEDREEARRKLIDALKTTSLFGVTTNKRFLIDALERETFAAGQATTAFIAENFTGDDLAMPPLTSNDAAIAAILLHSKAREEAVHSAIAIAPGLLNWSSATKITTPYRFASGDEFVTVEVTPAAGEAYDIVIGEQTFSLRLLEIGNGAARVEVEGKRQQVFFNFPKDNGPRARIQFSINGRDRDIVNDNAVIASAEETGGAGSVTAPMHGLLLKLLVEQGQAVSKGDKLAIVEAMKMQHELIAQVDGPVTAIHFPAGEQVAAGALIMEIDSADE